jgi:hypothetical protein
VKEGTRRARAAAYLDRHATVLTLICMAVLVLVPTKIAYDASTNAGDAGEKASGAAHKASHAVVRLEDERRARIYDQNGIDHYFCGKSVAIEKLLTLLVTAALNSHQPAELTPGQLRARAVFEEVLSELTDAPKCEVLIPPPPKPKRGESEQKGDEAEARAEEDPSSTPPFADPTSTSAHEPVHDPVHEPAQGGSGGSGGHEGHSGDGTPPGGVGAPPESAHEPSGGPAPSPETSGPAQEDATPPPTASPPAETPPAEPPATEATPEEPTTTGSDVLGATQKELGTAVGGLVEGVCTTVQQLAGLCH